MYGSCRRIPGLPLTAIFMQRNLCGKHWARLWDMVDYLDDMQQYYVIWKEVITRSTGKCFLEVMKTQLFSSSWMSKGTFYTVMSLEQVHVWDGVQQHFLNTCCELVFFTKPLLQFISAYQDNQLELRSFFFFFLNAIYMQHVTGYNSIYDTTTLHSPLLEMWLPDIKN